MSRINRRTALGAGCLAFNFDVRHAGGRNMTVTMKGQPSTMAAPWVLIVDDEPAIRRLLGALLHGYGYRTILAADGVDARSAMAMAEVAAILCDVHLRGESGEVLVQDLLRKFPHTVALMMSGGGQAESEVRRDDHGICGCIAKPFEGRDVANRIAQALCGRWVAEPEPRGGRYPWPQNGAMTNALRGSGRAHDTNL